MSKCSDAGASHGRALRLSNEHDMSYNFNTYGVLRRMHASSFTHGTNAGYVWTLTGDNCSQSMSVPSQCGGLSVSVGFRVVEMVQHHCGCAKGQLTWQMRACA